jgi:formylglycine-generating enzyme required for sulfatase activity
VQGKRNLGRIIKWSVSSGKGTTLADEPDVKFTQGMLSGDGRRLLTRSSTGALRVRDTAKGTLLASTYLRNGADGIALSLNGELAACGMADGTIRLWDIRSGRERLPLEGHLRRVNSLAFSPDGKRLASGSDDMTIRIWNLEQLNPEKLTVAPPSGPLLSATVNSLGMSFVNIPAGEFRMGESQEDAGMNYYVGEFRLDQERPVIRVRLTRGFEMAQHELTVSQFREFVQATKFQTDAERDGGHRGLPPGDGMPRGGDRALTWRSPGFPQTDDHPVVQVSWNDATAFCEWLSRKEGVVYRLPTEAEWEYACRAGTSTMWTFGNDHNLVGEHANSADATILEHISQYAIASWYEDGFPFTAPAGSFAPNPFGLYDMHGNVGEWCYDDYQPFYYRVSSGIDPRSQAHINGASPVFRGGAFSLPDYRCRSASRAYGYHEAGISYVGIRLVREIRVPAR